MDIQVKIPPFDEWGQFRVDVSGLPGKSSVIRGAGQSLEQAFQRVIEAIIIQNMKSPVAWDQGHLPPNRATDVRAVIDPAFLDRSRFDLKIVAQGGDTVRSYSNEPAIDILSILSIELSGLRGHESEPPEEEGNGE